MPYVLYPEFLLNLMRKHRPTIKAVALVDQEELFWREKIAEEICRYTPENSTRVFVFRNEKHLRENFPMLRRHARRYNVRVMSHDQFARDFGDHVYDFSIIGAIEARVLARYEWNKLSKWICFSTDREDVSNHEDIINGVINDSRILPNVSTNDEAQLSEEEDRLAEAVFRGSLTSYKHKPIEMSAYIHINDYDEHEEEHAYYVEMMEKMISIIEEHRSGKAKPTTILELGAGTGLFTKRLMRLSDVQITALEIDWACFHNLEHTTKRMLLGNGAARAKINCLNKDSRTFDPGGPDQKFQYIVSSFADHHIKPYDKAKYFENVKRNLEKGALFVVGDEFLPNNDRNDNEARCKALEAYHGHIISLAKDRGQDKLAGLEEEALQSGIDEIGDFKLSCNEYEQLVAKAGFDFEKELIGPSDPTEIGGVYVYRMWQR